MSVVKEFTKGFWQELPPFRLVLGLCPTLAVTTMAEKTFFNGKISITVRVEAVNPDVLSVLARASESIMDARFSPDGTRIAAGDAGSVMHRLRTALGSSGGPWRTRVPSRWWGSPGTPARPCAS